MNIDNDIAVFIDLARAFDTVPHDNLLNDLLSSDRDKFLKINKTLSSLQKVQICVPQGTVLGSILFITYINIFLNIKIRGTIISYADDTVILFTGSNFKMKETAKTD